MALTLSFLPAFQITYPKKGDLVNVYNGLPVTWSYNSSDSILFPLTIQFVPISHNDESPTYVRDHLNITLGVWTIHTDFPVADAYDLRLIYANNFWETGSFQVATSEQSKNASDTSSSDSSNHALTSDSSSTTLLITESTSTGSSSLAQGTTRALGSGATATTATTRVSSSREDNDNGLSTGPKVGIGIGCAAAAIIGIVGLSLLYRIKKKRNLPPEQQNLSDFDSKNLNERSNSRGVFEAHGTQEAVNMPELPSDSIYTRGELPG
jgi:hypothetical protein